MQAFRILTPLVLLRKCAPLRKQSESVTLSESLNLSGYKSVVPVPNNITRRSNNAVIHSLQISLLVGLSNRSLEEWRNQGCASGFNSELLSWNRPKYLSSTYHLTPD